MTDKPDPDCACCGNAYHTQRLCDRCRRDPANVGWAEADQELAGRRPARWKPTRLHRRVAVLALAGYTRRAIARKVRKSVTRVQQIAEELGV